MKIAVMGAGALGCYFGGRMQKSGADVSYIARGAHLAALQRDGLKVKSPFGDFEIAEVRATDAPGEIGPVDLVMFLVKLYDTDAAAKAMAPLLGPETAVVSFQNGIDAWDRIAAIVGEERVIGGTAVIPADIRAPGLISHNGPFAKLTFGEFDRSASQRCQDLFAIAEGAGVDAEISDDIDVAIWRKFLMLSALSAITTLVRAPVGPIRANPDSWPLFEAAIRETFAVGQKVCPRLSADAIDGALEMASGMPGTVRASMLDDLERGKRLELAHLSGVVMRLGKEHGVATPTHAVAYRALAPYVDGPPAGLA